MTEATRRGFLGLLLGATVIAVLPSAPVAASRAAKRADPFAIEPPEGMTYQWVRTSLLGEPDHANVQARLDNGWRFVRPRPGLEAATETTLGDAIERGGLVLMEKPVYRIVPAAAHDRGRAGQQ